VTFWAEASKRDVTYALANDRRTLLWFANQRAVEYHPALGCGDRPDRVTHLVLDLDPPEGDSFPRPCAALWCAGAGRRRLDGGGEDQRGQGRARLRAHRRRRAHRGRCGATRAIARGRRASIPTWPRRPS
jgi:hypothetical protein